MENARQKSLKSGWFVASAIILIPVTIVIYQSCKPRRMATGDPVGPGACKAFAEAEEIYHRTDYTGNGVLKYAQSLSGANSLLERTAGAADLAFIDKTFGNAEIGSATPTPKAGYVFKILKQQGPNAPGGRRSYIDEHGDMTRGYALVARPGEYDSTGRLTYMISCNGTIFEADLGPNTAAIVDQMIEFDPDQRWVPTQ